MFKLIPLCFDYAFLGRSLTTVSALAFHLSSVVLNIEHDIQSQATDSSFCFYVLLGMYPNKPQILLRTPGELLQPMQVLSKMGKRINEFEQKNKSKQTKLTFCS